LAFHFMIERHDQHLMHGGMALEQRLDLYWKDVLTTAHEHVVVASDEIIETFFIATADVAGVVPTITQAAGRFSRQVVGAEQHAGVLHRQFTFSWIRTADKLRFGPRIRHTYRARRTRLTFGMWA